MECFRDLLDGDAGGNDTYFRSHRKKRVGGYVLGRTLGAGSFAKVRLGVHLASQEKVAVKIVKKHVAVKQDYARHNLHREAAMLQRLDHPNIIKLYEVMETDKHYYIVTELADGCDFMAYITKRSCLCEEETRTYFRQMVSAIDHMHQSGVVHRDLKIENFMFDKDMNVKIIDLGLGNAWDGHNLLSTQCGSPAYAAPEVFSRKPYGPEVDLWSLGVSLYAMLSGSLPFTADPPDDLGRLQAAILKGCDPPSNVSQECGDVVRGLLVPDSRLRMTMADLKANPWLRAYDGPLGAVQLKTRPAPGDLDEALIAHVGRHLGVADARLRDSLLGNKVNTSTATYRLIAERKARGSAPPPLVALGRPALSGNGGTRGGTLQASERNAGGCQSNSAGGDRGILHRRQQTVPTNVPAHACVASEEPQSRTRSKSSSRTWRQEASSEGRAARRPSISSSEVNEGQPCVVNGAPIDGGYKALLSKLRSHRQRAGRGGILKPEVACNQPSESIVTTATVTGKASAVAVLDSAIARRPVVMPMTTAVTASNVAVSNSDIGGRPGVMPMTITVMASDVTVPDPAIVGRPVVMPMTTVVMASDVVVPDSAIAGRPVVTPMSTVQMTSVLAVPNSTIAGRPGSMAMVAAVKAAVMAASAGIGEYGLPTTRRRAVLTHSAGAKSVRFNLTPDPDDAATVASFCSQGHPSQLERLVLQRLSAQKDQRRHHGNHRWRREGRDGIHSGSPEGQVVENGTSAGRLKALRALRRIDRQNMPPAPPNSALGNYGKSPPVRSFTSSGIVLGLPAVTARGRHSSADEQVDGATGSSRTRQVELLAPGLLPGADAADDSRDFRWREVGGGDARRKCAARVSVRNQPGQGGTSAVSSPCSRQRAASVLADNQSLEQLKPGVLRR